MKIILKTTGEIIALGEETPLNTLSELRKQILMEVKELEKQVSEIDTLMTPWLDRAVADGDQVLANFWTIQRGVRRFDRKLFEDKADIQTIAKYVKAKDTVKEIEEEYKVHGKPFLKFPKLSWKTPHTDSCFPT